VAEDLLIIITYDEHGGFYEHVPASKPILDSAAPEPGGFAPIGLDPGTRAPIDHYGFRVPTFVVTPWVPAASVGNEEYDHTSILKTVIARFLTARPPDVGLRVLLSKDVGSLSLLASPRVAIRPPRIRLHPCRPRCGGISPRPAGGRFPGVRVQYAGAIARRPHARVGGVMKRSAGFALSGPKIGRYLNAGCRLGCGAR
jgi:Phosphoesterase family